MAVAGPPERPLTRRLLLRLVALLVTAGLVVAGIAVYDQRRNADAVAAQAFRAQLRPVVEAVYDQVQPLVDAERQRDDDASGGFSVYVDVARAPGAAAAVRAQQDVLAGLRAPGPLSGAVERLARGLGQLAEALDLHATLPFDATAQPADLSGESRRASDRLRAGLATWRAAVSDLYAQRPPAVPRPDPPRRAVSRAAYLLEAGRACGRADATGEGQQEEPTDASSAGRSAAREAAVLRELVAGLLAVPLPAADRPRLERAVRGPLREYGARADVLDRLAVAGVTPEALFRELVAADAAAARVAEGLGDYGSRTCALYLGS